MKSKNNEKSKQWITGAWWTAFMSIFFFFVHPLVYHHSYLDILQTKAIAFYVITGIYIAGCCVIMMAFGRKQKLIQKQNSIGRFYKKYFSWEKMTLVFGGILGISVMITSVISDNRKNTLLAWDDRLYGSLTILCCVMIFFLFFVFFQWNRVVMWSILGGMTLVSLLAIANRLGMDPLKMYDAIDPNQITDYLSTIGQMNILSGYLCLFVPFVTGLFLYAQTALSKVVYGISMFLGLLAGMISNSDSFYLCMCVFLILYSFLSLCSVKKVLNYLLILSIIFLDLIVGGQVAQSLGNEIIWGTVSRYFLLEKNWIPFFFIDLICCILWYCFICKNSGLENVERILKRLKRCVGFFYLIILVLFVIVVGYVNLSGMQMEGSDLWKYLIVNDDWGTNRGYVWKRTLELYENLPLTNKIFGIGPGGFSDFFSDYTMDAIMEIGYYFEDAHNEFLQFLVTTGMVGVIGYFGMILSSIAVCIKKKNQISNVLAVSLICWIVQGLVNNPVIITTFFCFLFMGMQRADNDLDKIRR